MRLIIGALILAGAARVMAAGAVVGEPGSCIIEVGIHTAHFTVYQPDTRGNEEFCEDLPDTGNTLFVMDYLHGSLAEVPLEFRILRDVEDWGIFARWENVAAIENLEARTVFYRPPTVTGEPRLRVEHVFNEPGGYIGVVTAPHPTKDIVYHAVFPFQVGRVNWFPWLLAATVLVLGAVAWRRRQGSAPGADDAQV